MAFTRKKINTTTADSWLAVEGGNIALARAPNGTLWALYTNTDTGADRDILVAYSSDGGLTWTEETALANGRISNYYLGQTFALMVDSLNVPHIVFIGMNAADLFEGRIRYLSRSGGSWGAAETVDDADASTDIWHIVACIDSTNTFHIIAQGTFGATAGIHYWTGTTGSWSAPQSVDSGAITGASMGLTVTSADLPICIYVDAGGIKYNTRSGGTWANEETIETTGLETTYGLNIVIDSANDAHTVWVDRLAGEYDGIKYRKRTSGVWGTAQIVLTGVLNDYGNPILGIDSSNNVYVVYQYAQSTDQSETVWYKQIVSEVVGSEVILDTLATQPDGRPSPYAYLWHRFPSSGILSPGLSPACLLLDETGANADVYLLYRSGGSEDSGTLWIENESLKFLSKSGVERTLGETQFANATVTIDLSAAAVSGKPILHTSRALTLLKTILLYTEASSADAGVLIEIGKESDADYYYTGTSEVSKALWYEKDVTLLKTDLAAGDTLICGCAGGKTGTGEVLVVVEYKLA